MKCDLSIVEENLTPARAVACEELIMAATTKDIVPRVKFDDQTIGNGACGKHTKALIEEFARLGTRIKNLYNPKLTAARNDLRAAVFIVILNS